VATLRLIKKTIKNRTIKTTDTLPVPGFINRLLISILDLESKIISLMSLPFGVSLICISKKTNQYD
jgi:hypothetical protein